jgi:hypothetical protein
MALCFVLIRLIDCKHFAAPELFMNKIKSPLLNNDITWLVCFSWSFDWMQTFCFSWTLHEQNWISTAACLQNLVMPLCFVLMVWLHIDLHCCVLTYLAMSFCFSWLFDWLHSFCCSWILHEQNWISTVCVQDIASWVSGCTDVSFGHPIVLFVVAQ